MPQGVAVTIRPLLIVWTVLGLVGGLSLSRAVSSITEGTVLLAIGAAWGALVFAGVRTQALLQVATSTALVTPSGPVHRIAPLLPFAIVLGAAAGLGFGGALFGVTSVIPPRWTLIVMCPLFTPPLVLIALRAFTADTAKERSRRTTTLFRWIVLDTALPAAIVCGPFSAGFVWLRRRPEASGDANALVDVVTLSRHFALTFVIWGLCVGTAAFMKTRRERLGGLIDAPIATAVAPSPAALGGILAIVLLVIGPRVLSPQTLETAVLVKGLLGVGIGGLLSVCGAIRGARDPAETIRPR